VAQQGRLGEVAPPPLDQRTLIGHAASAAIGSLHETAVAENAVQPETQRHSLDHRTLIGHATSAVIGSLHETAVAENAVQPETQRQLQPQLTFHKTGIAMLVGIWCLLVTRLVGVVARKKTQRPRMSHQI